MEAGRETHVRVGHLLAPARFREIRIQREAITGQIDLFEDRPTELKTTRLASAEAPDRSVRTAYLEQLAMYCALTDAPEGRLVLVDPEASPPAVAVFDLRVPDLAAVWHEMRARAETLRRALERRSPEELPACPWRGRGCEFEAAEVCDCKGTEPGPRPSLAALAEAPTVDPTATRVLSDRLATPPPTPPPARRFRDLVYPRRAYYERTEPPAAPIEGAPAERRPVGDDLYRTLSDLLDAGPTGEVTREPTPEGEPIESVVCLRGDPVLLKVSRAWAATPLDELPGAQPQYFLELALRCAALGKTEGWLLLGYSRAPSWSDRAYLYRVQFPDRTALVETLAERRRALQRAIEARAPEELPRCPAWMFEGCAYRSRCGCGGPFETPGRVNR